jgi:hypothetical protein
MGPGPGPGPQPGMSPGGGGPSTPQRGQPQPQTPTRQAKGGTPRAPGHLAGAGGTPVPGRKCLAHGVAGHTKLRCAETPGTPIPIPEGLTAEQAAALQMQMQAIQPVLPTPEKKWYDRVVDSILGDDPCECISFHLASVCTSIPRSISLISSESSLTPYAAQASQSKYALVCGECFRHNGLVGSKYEWERMRASPHPVPRVPADI